MPRSFNCPNCGGPLTYAGGDATMQCPFCANTVIVPEELRAAGGLASGKIASGLKKLGPGARWLLIFFIIIFVVPSCLGLIGTVLGVAAGIGAPIKND